MKDNWLKRFLKALFFPNDSKQRILIGPLRGFTCRVNAVTGLSPLYSGAEKEHQRWMRNIVTNNDTVIDIGANWGLHTLYLSKLVGNKGCVIAYEPFKKAFDELSWHVETNHCWNVKFYQMAIADYDGRGEFFVPNEAYTQGRLNKAVNDEVVAAINGEKKHVPVRKLDTLFSESSINSIKFIKIDVEGAGSEVLKGAKEIIQKFRPSILMDLHNSGEYLGILNLHKYQYFRPDGPQISKADIDPLKRGFSSVVALPV